MSQKKPKNIEALNFEQAFAQLEAAVQKLEAGNLSLEEALDLYRQGMALAQHCNLQLDNAELSIKALSPSGNPVEFEAD